MQILGVGAAVLALDMLTKSAVRANMTPNQSIPVVPGVFHLTYVLNPGAAFGLFAHRTGFFVVMAVLVIATILFLGNRLAGNDRRMRTALGLMLGGAAGNLPDRVIAGRVTDFLDFRIWPVFNVADASIVIGVCLVALDILLEGRRLGRR